MANEPTINIKKFDKVAVLIIAIGTALLSTVGSYIIFKTTTDYRITDLEKHQVLNDASLKQQEEFGHPDHERRITKLEARADGSEHEISEIKSKLDVCVAILQRIETEVNKQHEGNK